MAGAASSGGDGLGPRILHLIPADGIGGVEVAAKSMLARDDLPCRFRIQFIESSAPAGRTAASAARIVQANWRTLFRARLFRPDVIICSLWRSVPLALALRSIHRRAKLVFFIHASGTTHKLDTTMSALALRAADEIWGDSAAALAARGAPKERSHVISFVTGRVPMTAKPFMGARFVSWGRYHPLKGYDRAIRLAAVLADRGLDIRYDLYGPDGGQRAELQSLIQSLGVEKRVFLHGPVSRGELAGLAQERSFFLQLSRSEGMCMAAVEAMQYGLVPAVTPVGEMARYVVPGQTGVLVDPERMAEGAAAIEALVADPQAWQRHSAAAMRFWQEAPLYADDVCRAAIDLVRRR